MSFRRGASLIPGLLLTISATGCNELLQQVSHGKPEPKDPAAVQEVEPTVSYQGKSVDELVAAIDAERAEAEQVAELLKSGVNYQLRMKAFRGHVANSVAACDALSQHEEATDTQRLQAEVGKMEALYKAAKTDRITFEPRLAEEVHAAIEQDPAGHVSGVGEALLLELTVLSGEATHEEKMESLAGFARRHRTNPAGPALYLQYGDQLEDHNADLAIDCYSTAMRSFPASPSLNPIQNRLIVLENARREREAKEQAKLAKIAAIKRQLGWPDGYFLIYSREKNKTMYRFEYDLCKGPDEVVKTVWNLPNTWEWKVYQRFPENKDGFDKATALRNERVKKETVMTIPVYSQ